MAHLIDESKGQPAIAYAGERPWHGLGKQLTPDAGIEVWTREAGLDYEVKGTPVLFDLPAETPDGYHHVEEFAGRQVLYRSDTRSPLSVVSSDYKLVQPADIMAFFAELTRHNGFQLEVAGALDGGKKVWGLARVNEGAPVVGHDVVRPYVLLATSYDGTLSTTAKFTGIRVVCDNTITMAAGGHVERGTNGGQTERDKTDGAVVQCVRIPHSKEFKPEEARRDLGIVLDAYDRFLVEARLLAETKVDEKFVVEFLKALLPKPDEVDGEPVRKVEDGRTFKQLMALWKGELPSATLPEAKGTAWGLLNTITWHVDHLRGQDRSRLNSAWFGTGEGMKNKARDLLAEIVS